MSLVRCPACHRKRKPIYPIRCSCGLTLYENGDSSGNVFPDQSLPCKYRGEVQRHITCNVCGKRGETVPVHRCEIYGECTILATNTRPRVVSCLTCMSFEPAAAESEKEVAVRVAVLTPYFTFGGGFEQWLHSLVTRMPKDVEFVGMGILTDENGICHWDRRGVEYVADRIGVGIGPAMCRMIVEQSDVVMVWGISSLEPWFPERPKKPIVYTNHGCTEWSTLTLLAALDWADEFVAVGESAYAVHPRQRLIPNGVDLTRCNTSNRLREELRRELEIPGDALVVGQIGRLVWDKDPQAVARAVAGLGEKAWGLLVGNGPEEYLAEAVRIAEGRLRHLPATPDIARPLSAMDVFVFGSLAEGFGLAIAEAWAAGVPTVSTPTGLALSHPECTVTVPFHADPDTLARAVRRAYTNRRMVLEARKLVRTRYNSQRTAESWRELLIELKGVKPREVDVWRNDCSGAVSTC